MLTEKAVNQILTAGLQNVIENAKSYKLKNIQRKKLEEEERERKRQLEYEKNLNKLEEERKRL